MRLGKNFWTTLDNNLDMTIGVTKIPAGQWYLGLSCSEKGEWALMVMNAQVVRERRMDAVQTLTITSKINAPLTYAKTDKKVEKLTIELQKSDAQDGAGMLMIAWGNHKLTAPIKLDLESAKKDPAKKGDDEQGKGEKKQPEPKKLEPKKGEAKVDKQEDPPRDTYEHALGGATGYHGGGYRF